MRTRGIEIIKPFEDKTATQVNTGYSWKVRGPVITETDLQFTK